MWGIIVSLIFLGVLVWGVNLIPSPPLPPAIKVIIQIILALIVISWALNHLGYVSWWGPAHP